MHIGTQTTELPKMHTYRNIYVVFLYFPSTTQTSPFHSLFSVMMFWLVDKEIIRFMSQMHNYIIIGHDCLSTSKHNKSYDWQEYKYKYTYIHGMEVYGKIDIFHFFGNYINVNSIPFPASSSSSAAPILSINMFLFILMNTLCITTQETQLYIVKQKHTYVQSNVLSR